MSKEKIDRNSEKDINIDIDFINGILKYLKDKDYVSVEVCLTDWKEELERFREERDEQEQPKVDLEKVWDWIDKTFTETEIIDSRYGETINIVRSVFDVCKSDLREKFEHDFGINAINK